ncbi:MAG: hypothetical protein WDO68_02015 [Gammaproteobacteria bacterium]
MASPISGRQRNEITTQIPSSVHLAVPRGSYDRVKLPIQVIMYRLDPKTFMAGLDAKKIDGMRLKIYRPARAVVDCFKFRNNSASTSHLKRCAWRARAAARYARLLCVEKPMALYPRTIE